MKISSSWKLHSQPNYNDFSSNSCVFSPDGKTFCQCSNSSITLITNEKTNSIIPPTRSLEQIKCIATVFTSPWILSIGTSNGRVIFYDFSTNKYYEISPDSEPVQFIKRCSFTQSHFTMPYPVLLIQYPRGICAAINLDNLLTNIKDNTPDKITFTKWQLSNDKNIHDSVVINTNIPTSFFPNSFQFPAVYSVGKPFLSVSSIFCPQTSKADILLKTASRIMKWIFLSDDNNKEKEQVQISRTSNEWELDDDKREGVSVSADPTGRYIAVCDTMFRVIIMDAIHGYITKVLKGYRDAQLAWFSPPNSNENSSNGKNENSLLAIYVPTREIIVVCTIPNGSMVAAAKVVRDGKLFQTIDENSNYGVSFVYPSGDVAILSISISTKENENSKDDSSNELYDNCQFNFPSIVTAVKNQSIQELQKLLLEKSWDRDEVKKLASNVSDTISGGYFIKILIGALNYQPLTSSSEKDESDFLFDIVNIISSKFKVENFDAFSHDFFKNNNSSLPINGENDLIIYKVLSSKWSEFSKFDKISVSEDQYPQTNLTDRYKNQVSNVIYSVFTESADSSNSEVPEESIKRPSLLSFLTNPLKSPLFFFSFMRTSDITVNSIYDSFRISRVDRNEFILQFLAWIVNCQPAQVLITQEAITDFLTAKSVKSNAVKIYKKLDVGSDPFKAAAISAFLSS